LKHGDQVAAHLSPTIILKNPLESQQILTPISPLPVFCQQLAKDTTHGAFATPFSTKTYVKLTSKSPILTRDFPCHFA
jgi:hypothetical protein